MSLMNIQNSLSLFRLTSTPVHLNRHAVDEAVAFSELCRRKTKKMFWGQCSCIFCATLLGQQPQREDVLLSGKAALMTPSLALLSGGSLQMSS